MDVVKYEKMNIQRKERVAFYCRVSSKSDDQENSYDAQVRHYTKYQSNHPEYDYVGIYADEGISGRVNQEKRIGFYNMLSDCRKGLIDRIVVKSISRFSRNTVVGLKSLKELEKLGISVHFESDGIDTKIINQDILLTVMNYMTQNESVKLSDSCSWGYKKRFAKGHYKHSKAPYGYDLINNGELVVNDEKALVVKKIFELAYDGYTIYQITKYLNDNNIKSPSTTWSRPTVTLILKNERYIGDMLLQKEVTVDHGETRKKKNRGITDQYYVLDTHPPIIAREMFEKVNRDIQSRANKFNKNTAPNIVYPLTKKINCIECNSNYIRRISHKGKPYEKIKWICSKHHESSSNCQCKAITQDEIYDILKHQVSMIKGDDFEVLNHYIDSLSNDDLEKNPQYINLKKELANIKKQIAFVELEINLKRSAFLIEKLLNLRKDEEEIITKMNMMKDKASEYDIAKTIEIIDYLHITTVESIVEIEAFINKFITGIYLDNNQFIIHFKGHFKQGGLRCQK